MTDGRNILDFPEDKRPKFKSNKYVFYFKAVSFAIFAIGLLMRLLRYPSMDFLLIGGAVLFGISFILDIIFAKERRWLDVLHAVLFIAILAGTLLRIFGLGIGRYFLFTGAGLFALIWIIRLVRAVRKE